MSDLIPKKRKVRSDRGIKRIERKQNPVIIGVQFIPDDPVDGAILRALQRDIARTKKTGVKANNKTVLIKWLSDYLGIDEKGGKK